MSLSSKVSRDVAVSFVMKISLKARGLILIPLLSVLIGVAEYGAYVQVIAVATLTANICGLCLNSGYVRYVHKTDNPDRLYSTLVITVLATSTIGGFLFALAAGPLAEYTLQDSQFSTLFLLGGILIPLNCLFQIGRSYFQAERRIRLFSILDAIDVYLSIGAIIIAVLFFETWIIGAFTAFLVAHGVVVIGIFVLIGYQDGFSYPSSTKFYECLRFSMGSMGHLVSQSLLDKIDRILLGFFLGASAVGIYSAAYSVAYLMLLYFRPLSISFFPEFSKLWEDHDYVKIQTYSKSGIRFVAILSIPSIAGFWLVGDALLDLLSTSTVASEGVAPLVLLATGMFAKGIGEIYAQLFFAANNSRIPALIQGGAVFLNLLLNIILIPSIGIIGAAAATVVSFAISTAMLKAIFNNYLLIPLPWNTIGQIGIATTGMTVLMWGVGWTWIVTVVVAPIVYFLLLFTIGGIRVSEIRFVANTIR